MGIEKPHHCNKIGIRLAGDLNRQRHRHRSVVPVDHLTMCGVIAFKKLIEPNAAALRIERCEHHGVLAHSRGVAQPAASDDKLSIKRSLPMRSRAKDRAIVLCLLGDPVATHAALELFPGALRLLLEFRMPQCLLHLRQRRLIAFLEEREGLVIKRPRPKAHAGDRQSSALRADGVKLNLSKEEAQDLVAFLKAL